MRHDVMPQGQIDKGAVKGLNGPVVTPQEGVSEKPPKEQHEARQEKRLAHTSPKAILIKKNLKAKGASSSMK
jgi:hypothetical protein